MNLTTKTLAKLLKNLIEESKTPREVSGGEDPHAEYMAGLINGRIGLATELMEILEPSENQKGE